MSARAARGLQRRQLDQATIRIGVTSSFASRQQPIDSAGVERQFGSVALTGAAISRQLDSHDVAFGGQCHANRGAGRSASTTAHATRRHQRHTKCVLQRARIGSHRLDIIGYDHGATQIPVVGMVFEQRQRRTHTIAGHQGFQISIGASRQLPQLLQQTVQSVGIRSQAGEHTFVGNTRRIEERGNRCDRRDAIAECMCQPTQQIVMYREPTRRAGVAAHV